MPTDGTTAISCPICANADAEVGASGLGDYRLFRCPQCGDFGLAATALTLLPKYLEDWNDAAAVLSYFVNRMPGSPPHDVPILNSDDIKNIVVNGSLPTPAAQADNLLRWIGDNVPGPGETVSIEPKIMAAVVGAKSGKGVQYILEGLEENGLIQGAIIKTFSGQSGGHVTPSFAGWGWIEELQRGAATGNMAFMAMQYGEEALDNFVRDHFAPAVAETGFHLQRLDDVPKAGLIDDRLRVEIQSCRFLIADLSHANNGAYWEAGYAEGLGKPEIYTCEQSAFDQNKTHFDTNHHLTVIWSYDDPEKAADNLKATIRATLPDAARQTAEV